MVTSHICIKWFLTAVLAVCACGVSADDESGESLVIDPVTGDYIVTYCCDENDAIVSVTLEPSTKVDPQIQSRLKALEGRSVEYRYNIAIGSASRRPLDALRFDPVSNIVSSIPFPARRTDVSDSEESAVIKAGSRALATPPGWEGYATFSHGGGLRISWDKPSYLEKSHGKFLPGAQQDGFGFTSGDLPGIGIAQFDSESATWAFPAHGPDHRSSVGQQLQTLRLSNFVPRYSAVPTFSAGNPDNPVPLLQAIRGHVNTWPGKNLMESVLNGQIISLFDMAITAYKNGDRAAGRTELGRIRAELRKKYPDLVVATPTDGTAANDQNLAARVLDFNMKFLAPNDIPANGLPVCSAALASPASLWPPNHKLAAVTITGVTDPEGDPVTIAITGVTQDEPVNGQGDGDTSPDAVLTGGRLDLRTERSGGGNGRVYRAAFTATDSAGGQCAGFVTVCVPHSNKKGCVDNGQTFNSLAP